MDIACIVLICHMLTTQQYAPILLCSLLLLLYLLNIYSVYLLSSHMTLLYFSLKTKPRHEKRYKTKVISLFTYPSTRTSDVF